MAIYKRNGKYESRFQINHVKYYRQFPEATNKPQAIMAEAAFKREIYEGRYGKNGQEIGSTDFVKYCEEVYKPTIKEHLRNWKDRFYNVGVLCRYFKGKRLKDITRIAVEKLRRDMLRLPSRQGRPRKPASVRALIITLSHIFSMAIDDELIGLNPCRKIRWKRGEIESHRERVLSYEEEARLMPELERSPETLAATIIALNTGLRRMGILRRKVADVDTAERTLHYVAKGGKKRVVPLNQKAWAVVEELMKHPTAEGYLFHTRTGYNLSAKGCAFHEALKRAKIEDFTFHDLRHTFATRIRNHTDPYTIRDLVAHADLKQTGDYITAPLADMRRAVEALGAAKVLQFEVKTG